MRLRNLKNTDEILNTCEFLITDSSKYKGKWKELFGNDNPIYIEIGMGFGKFIYENALKNPNINYIGIEKYDSVLVRALEKVENDNIPNLRFIRMDATEIDSIFDKEIDTIYLNFSDPWPKVRHTNRRLTSICFLKKYDNLFKDNMHIIFKTDNRHLFEFSVKEFTTYGYLINDICLNLHDEDLEDNISTEYEEKFSKKGMPIYKIDVIKQKNNV